MDKDKDLTPEDRALNSVQMAMEHLCAALKLTQRGAASNAILHALGDAKDAEIKLRIYRDGEPCCPGED